ncbi:ceramide synthase 4a isoform X2 [Pseudorasbora parva]|uniref:ceramide synthase 4a isoform X2 n=1 Tax=Pseudorasbora parva TaxID=51549 RepID=UPI00351E4EC1
MERLEELINHWIWRQDFWLPPGVSWKDIAEGTSDGSRHPLPRDLLISLPLALGFIALRFVFERVVALPLSRWLGVRDRVQVQVTPVPKLEAFYLLKKKQPSQSDLVVLEKHCGLTQRQIQTWLRQRRNQDRPSNTRKFCEASWRFVFYLTAFSAGLISLINTPWFWDHRECWRGYPRQSAKMFNYGGWRKTCDALFVVFAAVFLVTRLVVFPCRVIYTAVVDSLDVFLPYPGYYFLNGLLLVLQALHIFWAWLILRMVHKFVFVGKVERDERSDEESEADEDDEVGEEEYNWEQKKGALNSKLASLANNCVLNNLTNQRRKMNSRTPKAR